MELYQVRAFATVARLGHLTRAAGELIIRPEPVAHTTLWLVYPRGRESDSALAALRSVMRMLWPAPT